MPSLWRACALATRTPCSRHFCASIPAEAAPEAAPIPNATTSLSHWFDSEDVGEDRVEAPLADQDARVAFRSCALLGLAGSTLVYHNTDAPSVTVAVGVQGRGKSHAVGCMVEGILLGHNPDVAGPGTLLHA